EVRVNRLLARDWYALGCCIMLMLLGETGNHVASNGSRKILLPPLQEACSPQCAGARQGPPHRRGGPVSGFVADDGLVVRARQPLGREEERLPAGGPGGAGGPCQAAFQRGGPPNRALEDAHRPVQADGGAPPAFRSNLRRWAARPRCARAVPRRGPRALCARAASPPSRPCARANLEIRRSDKNRSCRLQAVFGPRGPSPGLGVVKRRRGTEDLPWGSDPDLRGPRIE
ncbi:unnamed protein product, partial [Prorocentrum cordatum]